MKSGLSGPYRVFRWIMTLMIIVLAGSITAANRAAMAEEHRKVELKTSITEATVYRSGNVKVVRSGRAEPEPGFFSLVCEDLPPRFDESTLIVNGRSESELKIIGVDLRSGKKDRARPGRYRRLVQERDSLSLEKESLIIEKNAYQKRLAFLSSLGDFTSEKAKDKLAAEAFSAKDWLSVIDFIQRENIAADRSISGIDREIKKIEDEIRQISSRLAAMKVEEGGKTARIDCELKGSGAIRIDISYMVPSASWKPAYTVRHHRDEGVIELEYDALISQSTGEDWKDVAVTLSTATPHLGASAPAMKPHYLRRVRRPPVIPVSQSKIKDRSGAVEEALSLKAGAVRRETPDVLSSEYAVDFRIKTPLSLSTGLQERRIMIKSARLPLTPSLYCAPRLSERAYAVGKPVNKTDTPLLPGKAGIYVESKQKGEGVPRSTFIGNEHIPPVAPEQEFKLDLGIDQEIKAEHKLVKKEYLSKTRDRRKEIRYHYVIKLQNFKSGKARIKVEDRVPVSAMDDIDIDDVDISPDPGEKKKDGIIFWDLTLGPQEKMELSVEYTVKFPQEWPEGVINLE